MLVGCAVLESRRRRNNVAARAARAALSHQSIAPLPVPPSGCKAHNPEGCWRNTLFGYRRVCPVCIVLPVCSILCKIR